METLLGSPEVLTGRGRRSTGTQSTRLHASSVATETKLAYGAVALSKELDLRRATLVCWHVGMGIAQGEALGSTADASRTYLSDNFIWGSGSTEVESTSQNQTEVLLRRRVILFKTSSKRTRGQFRLSIGALPGSRILVVYWLRRSPCPGRIPSILSPGVSCRGVSGLAKAGQGHEGLRIDSEVVSAKLGSFGAIVVIARIKAGNLVLPGARRYNILAEEDTPPTYEASEPLPWVRGTPYIAHTWGDRHPLPCPCIEHMVLLRLLVRCREYQMSSSSRTNGPVPRTNIVSLKPIVGLASVENVQNVTACLHGSALAALSG
ncbi:hypothetical protein R3P38DRAFT_2793044 [Favolaschia claudopus]|uniref:Uncharacterized protein n=1 Tax=Favolaschia claudopus TaxID=2862362 RepID=A0AAW0AEG2_9AGAR